jgi:hypothetical protein
MICFHLNRVNLKINRCQSKEIIEFDTLINNQLDYLIKNHNYKYFHYSYINHMLTYV